MRVLCCLCGHEDPIEIVSHVNEVHEGLKSYQEMFPGLPVAAKPVFEAVKNEIKFGFTDEQFADLGKITDEDKTVLIEAHDKERPVRSEVLVTEE